jgi:predicted DNA-binding transcriptional regulator YafY
LQGKYVKALPLHRSQNVIKDDDESVVVELLVQPNQELEQELMALGDRVRVLEPTALARSIAKAHKAALKQYKA